MPLGNVLVVEDEPDWREIYLRNAHPKHAGVVRETASLADAREAIREMAFSVAFVDIRLDENDDQNTDGLQVLELLRHSGDHTSAIMLTGHGTVGITRDALKKFDAFEAIEKADIEPREIQALVERGTDARNTVAGVEDPSIPAGLRGQRPVWEWDAEMLEVTGGRHGAAGLYELLEHLAGPLFPLAPGAQEDQLQKSEVEGVAMGRFWSRAVGEAVLLAFGREDSVKKAIENGGIAERAGGSTGRVLRDRSKGGLSGVAMSIPGRDRSTFS